MKKNFVKINLNVFPFILAFAFFVSILESYTYIGFFQKHFYIASSLIYLLSFINFVGLTRSKGLLEKLYKKQIIRVLLGLGTLTFFVFTFLYVILNEMEVFHYDNFVFATFHIWPGSLIVPVVLSFETALLFFRINRNFVKLDKKVYRKIKLVFISLGTGKRK